MPAAPVIARSCAAQERSLRIANAATPHLPKTILLSECPRVCPPLRSGALRREAKVSEPRGLAHTVKRFAFSFYLASTVCCALAVAGTAPEELEFFEKQVRPVLSEHCLNPKTEVGAKKRR